MKNIKPISASSTNRAIKSTANELQRNRQLQRSSRDRERLIPVIRMK
ncbi:hypothetical protein BN1095_4380002 [Clostridioides difficile]|uniref:Uncharacterized protein n=1 Tax=Clostridioides difficile TaxID=1496 RepID=A0A069AQ80_CLODI|nr:hypothetical protein BN1095_4380002 [Clostridioides difficile]